MIEPLTSSSSHAHDSLLSDARSEAREYLAARLQRRRLLPRAALVGFAAGAVALLFRIGLDTGDKVRAQMQAALHAHVGVIPGIVIAALVAAGFGALSITLVRRFAPEAAGSGIPHLEAVLRRYKTMHWQRILPVKFVSGLLAIGGAGMALGREGPTVQMGGSVGAGIASLLGSSLRERETLIIAGSGAGLAAAFNAPLSGLVFVLEEVQREFTPVVFAAALVATVVSDVVARIGTGQSPVFRIPSYPTPPLLGLGFFILLGAFMGLLGIAFNRTLLATLNFFAGWKRVPAWLPATLVAAVAGIAGMLWPELTGGGHGVAETALAGGVALGVIPMLFLLRFGVSMICYGCGVPGGIFAPLLALGALAGLALGDGVHHFAPILAPLPGVFAVVGMAAYFTAIVRAPLTGIVLIVEMTGSYDLMLPLLACCFTAYALAEALGDPPIYEALLERDLARSEAAAAAAAGHDAHVVGAEADAEPLILDLRVQPDAPFDGQRVRDLGLPPGCVLVTLRRDGREAVVTADTVLQEGDRIVAVVAPGAAAVGGPMLREGVVAEG